MNYGTDVFTHGYHLTAKTTKKGRRDCNRNGPEFAAALKSLRRM